MASEPILSRQEARVMARMTPLRRRLIDDMTVRNLSPATQQSYVYAVANFSRFFGQAPDRLGVEEVRAYQLHLAGLGRSWSHINQVPCALRFFFGVTLGRRHASARIVSAGSPSDLDSSRMLIRVEHGKGGKDHYVMLSPQLLA